MDNGQICAVYNVALISAKRLIPSWLHRDGKGWCAAIQGLDILPPPCPDLAACSLCVCELIVDVKWSVPFRNCGPIKNQSFLMSTLWWIVAPSSGCRGDVGRFVYIIYKLKNSLMHVIERITMRFGIIDINRWINGSLHPHFAQGKRRDGCRERG